MEILGEDRVIDGRKEAHVRSLGYIEGDAKEGSDTATKGWIPKDALSTTEEGGVWGTDEDLLSAESG